MSFSSEFAGNTLLHEQGAYEPQRKSNFALVLNNVNGQDTLTLSVKDVTLPSTALVQKGIKSFNQTMHYAGSVSPFADLAVNFHDYVDQSVLGSLAAWFKQTFDPATGAIGWAKDYKKSGTLYMLPPGISGATPGTVDIGSATADRTWVLQGVWLRDFKPDMFDNEDDGGNTLLQCQFSIDVAYPAVMEA